MRGQLYYVILVTMKLKLSHKPWWGELEHDLKELLTQSETLFNRVSAWEQDFHDYSFLVFPAAKAYEGFLKSTFLDLGLITSQDYYGKRFRIGRALNPELDEKKVSVYEALASFCGDESVSRQLWATWKESRNLLFHWFPNEINAVSYQEARNRIMMVVEAMDVVHLSCKIKK